MSEKFIRLTEGPSSIDTLSADTPSAGSNFSLTLPEGYTFLVLSCNLVIVTSAVVASRLFVLRAYLADRQVFSMPATGLQTASETLYYSLYPGATPWDGSAATLDMIAPLSGTPILPGGSRLISDLWNIDVGDQISTVSFLVQKWPVVSD